jgi:hypothetical protein
MNEDQLFQLYEKLYFHELDRREKLSARLNMPLAVLVAITDFLSYMLQNRQEHLTGWFDLAFWIFYLWQLLRLDLLHGSSAKLGSHSGIYLCILQVQGGPSIGRLILVSIT